MPRPRHEALHSRRPDATLFRFRECTEGGDIEDARSQPVASVKAAKDAGVATLNYGLFFNAVLNFLIVAFAVFLLIRQVNRMTGPAPAPATRDCPYCLMSIPIKATRCAHCTSEVRGT